MKTTAGQKVLALIAWLGFLPLAGALDFIQTNQYTLLPNETLPSELWLAAERITLSGQAEDDLFLLGVPQTMRPDDTNGVILVEGKCRNDVWALANIVEVTGQVREHARIMARTVTISGSIGRSALLMGSAVQLTRTARVGGDVWLGGENLIAQGIVQGRLTMLGQKATLDGIFATNVQVTAQDIVVLPGTVIGGNLIYGSAKELTLAKDVKLAGQLIRESLPVTPQKGLLSTLQAFTIQLWLFAAALLVGAVFFWLFPAVGQQAVAQLMNSFWKCLLVGFFVLALSPMICLLAAVSLVGLPLSLLIGIVVVLLLYLSKLLVAVYVGRLGPRGRDSTRLLGPFFIGLLVLYLGASAGVLGVILWFGIVCAGTGALVLALCGAKLLAGAATAEGQQSAG